MNTEQTSKNIFMYIPAIAELSLKLQLDLESMKISICKDK